MNCWVRLFKQLATKSGIEGIFFLNFFFIYTGTCSRIYKNTDIDML